jgi:hypothetical protein
MSAGPDIRCTKNGVTDTFDQPDVRSDTALVRSKLRHHRTQIWRIKRRIRLATQAMMHGVKVIADVPHMSHGTDQAEIVGQPCHPLVQGRNAHSRNGG